MGDFGGRYRLIRRLGGGGMGEVWLAADEELGGREVAIKTVKPDLLDAQGLALFHQEMRLACRMAHPNIMTVLTSGTENGMPFMVMEYLRGHDLSQRPDGWGGVTDIVQAGRETCLALACAHDVHGVVHRDIKPANLFLCDTGLLKVTDFGVAKILTASKATAPGTVIGTPAYMAPEQWLGQSATFAIDIWATGCVLYELLSGHRAREYSSLPEFLAAAVRYDRVAALPASGHVPQWLADAVIAMLEPDPANRPTASESAQLLVGPSSPAAPGPEAAQIPATSTVRDQKPQPARMVAAKPGGSAAFVPAGQPLEGSADFTEKASEFAVSPDGRFVVAMFGYLQRPELDVYVWDTSNECLAAKFASKRFFKYFSSDGRFLDQTPDAEFNWHNPERWDLASGRLIKMQAPNLPVRGFFLGKSNDGRHVAIQTHDESWKNYRPVFVVETGQPSASPRELRRRDRNDFSEAAFSPDRSVVAALARNTSYIYFWRTATGQREALLNPLPGWDRTGYTGNGLRQFGFLPDGRFYTAYDSSPRGKSVPSKTPLHKVTFWNTVGKIREVWSVAEEGIYARFSPDGAIMVIQLGTGKTVVWDTKDRVRLDAIQAGEYFFLPEGRNFAAINVKRSSAGYGQLQIWDTEPLFTASQSLAVPDGIIYRAASSADGKVIATVSSEPGASAVIRLWHATAH